ncbi:MAG: hypothetical protein RJA22_235 [Verrucomicrobiota bacterium]|jgi:hypothetical protein
MKRFPLLPVILACATLLAAAPLAQAQAEKVKQKAKDLKKQVEGGQTNKPPQKVP